MLQIIKLHIGLFKLIRREIKIKKSFTQLVKFFISVTEVYIKEIIKQYKIGLLHLDPMYRRQNKNYKKYKQYKKDITNAYKIIQWMIKQGENRKERQWIRRDFEKFGRIHKDTEKAILRDIYGVKE